MPVLPAQCTRRKRYFSNTYGVCKKSIRIRLFLSFPGFPDHGKLIKYFSCERKKH
jgi:hypothetical protein